MFLFTKGSLPKNYTIFGKVTSGMDVLDNALGRGLFGQIASLGVGLGLGGLAYVAAAKLLRIAELEQIMRLLRRR